jgi:hypothetical protein
MYAQRGRACSTPPPPPTLTTFVAVSVRKIYLHPATVMAALQLL